MTEDEIRAWAAVETRRRAVEEGSAAEESDLGTDIDVFLPGRYSLIGLVQENEANVIRRLGGTAESVSGARIRVALPNGKVDLSIVGPVPSEGQHEAWIDGRREIVLTNAQILRGKLDRPERVLVRDVVDVLVAAGADPRRRPRRPAC